MAANTLPAAISIHSFLLPCDLPPLPSEGEGWGEGDSMGCTNLIFPKQKSHPHPSLPPPDGGRNKVAVAAKSRLKPKSCFQTTFLTGSNQ